MFVGLSEVRSIIWQIVCNLEYIDIFSIFLALSESNFQNSEHWQRYGLIMTTGLYLRMLEFWVPLQQYTFECFLPGRKSFSFAYLLGWYKWH